LPLSNGSSMKSDIFKSLYGQLVHLFKNLPSISEYECFGRCCMHCKVHRQPKFDMIAEVHEATGIPPGKSLIVRIGSGRFEKETLPSRSDSSNKAYWNERVNVHVRQCDNIIDFHLLAKTPMETIQIGECSLNVNADLIEKQFPQDLCIQLTNGDKETGKLWVSFLKLDAILPTVTTPLLNEAIYQAQSDARSRGVELQLDWEAKSEHEKLVFFSKVIEGPLNVLEGFGNWQTRFFSAVEVKRGKWAWCFWYTKEDLQRGDPAIGSIPLLSVSLVLPDKSDSSVFYVKFHTSEGPRDMFLQKVDRPRDTWSDGMYQFIEMLREYLSKHPNDYKKGSAKSRRRSKQVGGEEKLSARGYSSDGEEEIWSVACSSRSNTSGTKRTDARTLKPLMKSFEGAAALSPRSQTPASVSLMTENMTLP